MKLLAVITQLRAVATVFDGNVAGAAAYLSGVQDQVWLPMPAAYVVPIDETAATNTSMTGSQQIITQHFGVIVVIDNRPDPADRRGQAAVQDLDTLQASIRKAIVNWRPDFDPAHPELLHTVRGIYESGAGLVDWDRARLHYQYEYLLDVTITEDDCWQPDGPPLIDIRGIVTAAETGDTLAVFDAPLPQT